MMLCRMAEKLSSGMENLFAMLTWAGGSSL
jgi:hypothetical protein